MRTGYPQVGPLRGGGAIGDFAELPDARLAVLPGTSHFIPPGSGVLDRAAAPRDDPPVPAGSARDRRR